MCRDAARISHEIRDAAARGYVSGVRRYRCEAAADLPELPRDRPRAHEQDARSASPARGARQQRIRLVGQGGRGINGGPPGDLFVGVHIQPDERFERDGDDLYVGLPVSMYTLILGGTVRVPTMTGEVELTIRPETQNE